MVPSFRGQQSAKTACGLFFLILKLCPPIIPSPTLQLEDDLWKRTKYPGRCVISMLLFNSPACQLQLCWKKKIVEAVLTEVRNISSSRISLCKSYSFPSFLNKIVLSLFTSRLFSLVCFQKYKFPRSYQRASSVLSRSVNPNNITFFQS